MKQGLRILRYEELVSRDDTSGYPEAQACPPLEECQLSNDIAPKAV